MWWYFKEETGNFAVGAIPMVEVSEGVLEQDTGWLQIATRPEPHDDYVFEGGIWITKQTTVLIPQVVTMRQARLALLQSNLLATVDTSIANGTDETMKIEWEYATEVRRDWASLIAMATSLGMTSAQLDDLFLLASTL